MKRWMFLITLLLGLALVAGPLQAQGTLNTTTLSAAITRTTASFLVASTANIVANTNGLFIPTTGEYMTVTGVPVSGRVNVARGANGTIARAVPTSALVLITQPGSTVGANPYGTCTGDNALPFFQMINLTTGDVNVCLLGGQWEARNGLPRNWDTTIVLTR